MKKYATKNRILGRIFLAVAIIAAVAFLGGFFTFSLNPDLAAPLSMLSIYTSVTFFSIYFIKFFWFAHTYRLLKKGGFENYTDDIDLTVPTIKNAKIYCGKKAFLCKKTGAVVAYDQIAWIYKTESLLRGYIIRLKNGKKAFIIFKNSNELLLFLNNYVKPNNPGIIEGKSLTAKKKFSELYPEAVRVSERRAVITGAVLSAVPILFITVGLIRNTIDTGSFIVNGIIEIIGIAFLLYGTKWHYFMSKAAVIYDWMTHSAFFSTLCKIGTILVVICMLLYTVSAVHEIELLFLPSVIGFTFGMIFLVGSIFLQTGFFAKKESGYNIRIPDIMLDDTSFITNVFVEENNGLFSYTFCLTDGYGWDYIRDSIDHLISADFVKKSFTLSIEDDNKYTDITKAYSKGKKTAASPSEWEREHSSARVIGNSKALNGIVGVIFYNQTRILRISMYANNEKAATAYAETLIRRSFGTPDQMKPAKPIPVKDPVSICDGHCIHIDTGVFRQYSEKRPRCLYEFSGAVSLTEKEPVLFLYEDGVKVREYRLQNEADEDFTGKYFLISVRLGIHGEPPVPAALIDGFVSDTPEDRKITTKDIGYRMEIYFMSCSGDAGKQRYKANRGQDLHTKSLKYLGYTTPSNIRLIGICPDCGKSFCFHGYCFYMADRDVAYSDDGLDCCEIQAYGIDKENWSYETEGKTFRYYNSFNCPYCGTPYIDYKKYPENKVFGVSGCVLLGKNPYRYE